MVRLAILVLGASVLLAGNDMTLRFTEELRFGGIAAEDPHYEWIGADRPSAFEIDSRGHIYVIDPRNVRILEFDAQGAFVRQLASAGQGPGEYQSIGLFQILKDGSAIGIDNLGGTLRRQIYDKSLQFQRADVMQGLAGFAPKIRFSPSGEHAYVWFIRFNGDTQGLTSLGAITDRDLEPIEIFQETPWPAINGATLSDRGRLVDGLAMQFSGLWKLNARIARYLNGDRLLFVDNLKNEITIRGPDNRNTIKRVEHNIRPQIFEQEQREAFIGAIEEHLFNQGGQALMNIVTPAVLKDSVEKANLPKMSYPVQDVIPMADGGFILVTEVDYNAKSVAFQIFDGDGVFKARGTYPGTGVWTVFGTRILATDTHLYGMEINDDGDTVMVRYKIE